MPMAAEESEQKEDKIDLLLDKRQKCPVHGIV